MKSIHDLIENEINKLINEMTIYMYTMYNCETVYILLSTIVHTYSSVQVMIS